MNDSFWKKVKTSLLLDHPRIRLVEDDVVLPQGQHVKYVRFEGLADYVTVIPVQDSRVALIKEYSYPLNEWLYQFPEGSIEQGESPLSCAARELTEEAALVSGDIKLIGKNFDHHRRSTAVNYVLTATKLSDASGVAGDIEEYGTEVVWVAIDELRKMVQSGDIMQKNALAALALFFNT